ncbi:MerR family transcriptional regulator [Candidatus Tenderia electrophaga]|jgi:DNA-binding transcriptional MerR regulator|uniref:MerR family transcriptional regulator n=1 Tax=Candidatus Tenderia electrophaga TaxID=1748243 RepID=A0A0S2TEX6_9GAMM|nr:MerR family transcriptional regulator [Candidatus Tenderia electrophaga]
MTQRISDITRQLGLSADTLRYYEKIGLLPKVKRTASGIRAYNDKDISRLKFIQRAQRMNFSLAEIKDLLQMREDPQHARTEVRELTHRKLADIENHLQDLTTLRNELTLLVNLCAASDNGCPIIEGIEDSE